MIDMHNLTTQVSLEDIFQQYKSLKDIYFQKLAAKNVWKSDVRAFVGIMASKYEALGSPDDEPLHRHVAAFDSALRDLDVALRQSKKGLKATIQVALSEWRESDLVPHRRPASAPLIPPPIPHIRDWHRNGLNMVSLFSGAFGLDIGFMAAGFNLRFATDIDHLSAETSQANLPDVPFVLNNFDNVTSEEILEAAGLNVGELDVLVGGPPCQPFSTAGKRLGFNDPRSSPLTGFVRAIKELRPRAFLMEEVPGLESSRLVHVPIAERGTKELSPEEEPGSAFREVLGMLKSTGYKFVYGRLNAADFGAPQIRERLVFIGLRDGIPALPTATHTATPEADLFTGHLLPWSTLWEATADLAPDEAEWVSYSSAGSDYMRLVPPGGHWRQLPADLIPTAMGGAYESGGGKMGFFRRLAWDEPAPTLVTSPIQKGSLIGHPDLLRPLSVQEYKRLQGFPDDWYLPSGAHGKYKLIGNAVSVHFSFALAKHIISLLG